MSLQRGYVFSENGREDGKGGGEKKKNTQKLTLRSALLYVCAPSCVYGSIWALQLMTMQAACLCNVDA